ncbi:MAG: hypothetical protein PHI34_02650 [Acidobacteriota bacterium]|nr:hypothetical protein [Acidobacteriota bacterium]
MNRYRRGFAGIGALVLWLAAQPAPAAPDAFRPVRPVVRQASAPASAVSFDETARFLSGLPCTSESLRKLQETPAGAAFMAAMDRAWADLEANRLKPMRAWAAVELAEARAATKTLFYPFGGPDFLTSFELFPDAETHILLGLEFVGRLPDAAAFTPERAAGYARAVEGALSDFFKKSYFITHNMDATLGRDQVDGVLPILCLFLERTGSRILAVKRCEFLATGEMMESAVVYPAKRQYRPYGVKVEYQAGAGGAAKSLYYFSCDLADKVFKLESALYRYMDALTFESTFIKSASYLMHYDTFVNIRDLVLAKSRFVLEDDTGIPFRFFMPDTWRARLYGEYIKPVKDFSGVEQRDLKAAYSDPASDVRKLPFHLGYHWGTNKDSYLYFERLDVPANGAAR